MLPLNPDLPDSPSFFLQDCVQLNQYKLQSEIGKVGLGPARSSENFIWGFAKAACLDLLLGTIPSPLRM